MNGAEARLRGGALGGCLEENEEGHSHVLFKNT